MIGRTSRHDRGRNAAILRQKVTSRKRSGWYLAEQIIHPDVAARDEFVLAAQPGHRPVVSMRHLVQRPAAQRPEAVERKADRH